MKNSYLLIAGLFLLTHQQTRAERIDTLLHFSYADLKVDTLTAPDGNTYTKLTYPGCWTEELLGAPSLPIKFVRFVVPTDAENISYELKTKNTACSILGEKVYPTQHPLAFSSQAKPFVPCNSEIYNSPKPYPLEQARITEVTKSHIQGKYVVLVVYPATYLPMEDKIDFSQDIALSLSYSIPTTKKLMPKSSGITLQTTGLPAYEYCVITSRALKKSFERLVAWKRQKGLKAGVVCVEDIIGNPYITADCIDATGYTPVLLTDSAAQIRQYLRLAKDTGITKYVLMGGEGSVVPIRYGSGIADPGVNNIENIIPSDLYFGEFSADWNKDKDQYFGEPGEVGYSVEIIVGRLLCSTSQEVKNYTDKLLWYEMNPGNGDFSYLQKALYVQADEGQKDSMGNTIASQMNNIFPNSTVIQEYPSYYLPYPTAPTGDSIISVMNRPVAYANFFAHGNPYEIFVRTFDVNVWESPPDSISYYAITSAQGARTISNIESANSIDKLTNAVHPMIGNSMSCYSAPFDVISLHDFNQDWTFNSYPCLGKSFTTGNGYGGPAWIGNTREGLVNSSIPFQTKINGDIESYPIGKAHSYAISNYNDSTYRHYTALSSNLIGCPEFYMWTAQPSLFSVTHDTNEWHITPGNTPSDISFGRRNLIENDSISISTENVSQVGAYRSIENGHLYTVYGRNYIPKILGLYLTDGDLTGTHYFFTKDVTCGGEGATACVTFTNGSDYTFETKGTFKMTKNVVIERGARLCIKPSNINF